jgi:hypothetical protein
MIARPDDDGSYDPAVASLLGAGARKAQRQAQPLADRRRQAKERQKAAARNRVTLDLPPELEIMIKRLADDNGCPISQVAVILLAAGLDQIDAGQLDLLRFRKPSRSPRYTWQLKDERY